MSGGRLMTAPIGHDLLDAIGGARRRPRRQRRRGHRRAQVVRPARGAQGRLADGQAQRGRRHHRARPARARRPSSAASTTSRRSSSGSIKVNGHLIGYRPRPNGQLRRGQREEHRPPAPRHRHGLPALQPVPAQDGAREHHRGADPGPRAEPRPRPIEIGRKRCWPGSASPTRRTPTRPSSRAASSSGWPSPGRWRCARP